MVSICLKLPPPSPPTQPALLVQHIDVYIYIYIIYVYIYVIMCQAPSCIHRRTHTRRLQRPWAHCLLSIARLQSAGPRLSRRALAGRGVKPAAFRRAGARGPEGPGPTGPWPIGSGSQNEAFFWFP